MNKLQEEKEQILKEIRDEENSIMEKTVGKKIDQEGILFSLLTPKTLGLYGKIQPDTSCLVLKSRHPSLSVVVSSGWC